MEKKINVKRESEVPAGYRSVSWVCIDLLSLNGQYAHKMYESSSQGDLQSVISQDDLTQSVLSGPSV